MAKNMFIGSSFVGDHTRHRLARPGGSTPGSTPPSSPPPPHSPAAAAYMAAQMQAFPTELYLPIQRAANSNTNSIPPAAPPEPPAKPLEPAQALELRLRWLEAILFGVRGSSGDKGKHVELDGGDTLVRRAGAVQRRMDEVVQGNDGLRRFVDHYQQHAHVLTPAFALSGALPGAPAYEGMAPAELAALLAELEPDIRAADRDMREIELLEQRGVSGAGKLPDYEPLQPRLDALIERYAEDAREAEKLEGRVTAVLHQYATQVDSLSGLFLEYDELLREAEDKIARLERDKADRERLGYE